MPYHKIIIGLITLICLCSVIAYMPNNAADIDLSSGQQTGYLPNDAANIDLYDTTSGPANQCIYVGSGDWIINNTNCNITGNTDVKHNDLYIINSSVLINATISNFTIWMDMDNSLVKQFTY